MQVMCCSTALLIAMSEPSISNQYCKQFHVRVLEAEQQDESGLMEQATDREDKKKSTSPSLVPSCSMRTVQRTALTYLKLIDVKSFIRPFSPARMVILC